MPSRRESARVLLGRMEPGPPGAADARDEQVRVWVDARRYFEQVSHHHHVFGEFDITEDDFIEHVRIVEGLLLDKLRPPAADDYTEIDTLMNHIAAEFDDR